MDSYADKADEIYAYWKDGEHQPWCICTLCLKPKPDQRQSEGPK